MNNNHPYFPFSRMLAHLPNAVAVICGSDRYPSIGGTVKFYQTPHGVLTVSELWGLPTPSDVCDHPIFALHIHDGNACTGNQNDPFANAKTHYNPQSCLHPHHAGDLPPLFGTESGMAFSAVLTDRYKIEEIIGKTVIVHASIDDFTTQPSGNAGEKIACGEIVQTRRTR